MAGPRLPPLTALRAFEAAARHLSFAKAAEELGVTPAALSFQIKSLEAHLGQPLFRRRNRAVELTGVGRALLPGASEGFETLRRAWAAARRAGESPVLTVTAGPGFTAKWLAPRLFRFAAAHPGIELRFVATLRLLDFARDEVDVAIRYGLGDDSGLYSVPLFAEIMTPMMTPDLARRHGTRAGFAGLTLIHDDSMAFLDPEPGWDRWCEAAGLPPPAPGGPRFSQGDHALDYGLEGGGAVLGRLSMAERDLRAGRLVAPFADAIAPEARYRFVCPEGAESRPAVAAFLGWVREELRPLDDLRAGFRLHPLV